MAAQAESHGLPAIDRAWLLAIQCPAGVRYGQPPVSLAEAVEAHHASLRVVANVIPHLLPPAPKPTTS